MGDGLLSKLRGNNRYGIGINSDLDLKERCVTFLHELLHIDTERDPRRKYHGVDAGGYPQEITDRFNFMDFEAALRSFVTRHQMTNDYDRLKSSDWDLTGAIEAALDKEAEEVYDCQPRLVEYLIKKYQLDREIQHSKSSPVAASSSVVQEA